MSKCSIQDNIERNWSNSIYRDEIIDVGGALTRLNEDNGSRGFNSISDFLRKHAPHLRHTHLHSDTKGVVGIKTKRR